MCAFSILTLMFLTAKTFYEFSNLIWKIPFSLLFTSILLGWEYHQEHLLVISKRRNSSTCECCDWHSDDLMLLDLANMSEFVCLFVCKTITSQISEIKRLTSQSTNNFSWECIQFSPHGNEFFIQRSENPSVSQQQQQKSIVSGVTLTLQCICFLFACSQSIMLVAKYYAKTKWMS